MKRKPTLVGSHTENSIGKYFKTLDDLEKQYENYKNATFRQRSGSRSIENDSLEETLHFPLLNSPQINKIRKEKVLDWWSKYEASKAKKQQEELQKMTLEKNLNNDKSKTLSTLQDTVNISTKKKHSTVVNDSKKPKSDIKKELSNQKTIKKKVRNEIFMFY